jgi:hypothetical protein
MIADGLQPWAWQEIDSICRKFLWAGKDGSVRGKCMVAWQTCTQPKEIGGLGITDLRLAGTAFEAKWLWLQKTDQDRAWSELPLRTSPEAAAFFRASTYSVVGSGTDTLFWTDNWIHGTSIQAMALTLFKLIPKRVVQKQTVAEVLPNRTWIQQIRGGLSVPAISDYLHVRNATRDVVLDDSPDRLIWRWASDGNFSVRSAYEALHQGSHPPPGCSMIWESWAPLKIKLFLWLALRRWHWTADRRRRHGLEAHDNCYLCDQQPESIDHIIVDCSYSKQAWWCIRSALRETHQLAPCNSILDWWNVWRQQWIGQFHNGAGSIFALVAWEHWKERNARCFRGASTQVPDMLNHIKHEAESWVQAGVRNLGCLLQRVIR